MDIDPPKSTTALVATSAVVVGAGAALGAGIGAVVESESPPTLLSGLAPLEGGVLGSLAAGLGGLTLSLFSPKWDKFGKTVALVGIGAPFAIGLVSQGARVLGLKKASAAPQLPAGSVNPNPQTYTADETKSGSTLNMRVGDQLVVTLPASRGGSEWQWAGNAAIIFYNGPQAAVDANNNPVENDSFTARAAGSTPLTANLVTTATGAKTATWQVTINVS